MKNKKSYRYPAFMVSASKDDMVIINELKSKYHVNISAFFREQVRKFYKKIKKNNEIT